ncbi:hypothetical protein XELAEV_18029567mg [Xenopus laevis]|uniref:Uncharacterized protein n=1 Tax=Xenopus laevis TaxID=8355 RepID=A0A974HHV8_XENLA|nr:hypothetical protein XELAEV_18029567mg [Xenopus laevis]
MALSMLDVLRVCTVLEDSLDQISIPGYIMPVSYHGSSDVIENEIGKILKIQRQLEGQFEDLMGKRVEVQTTSAPLSSKLVNLIKQVEETNVNLKLSNEQFAADVIAQMLLELELSESFHSLQQAVANEKERKANLYNVITR